ncbi:hypothetical protein [Pseudomonas protegens]|uniref:hypothetical protein n=1 Tax=Pseudomonas protegens TaxID=380021 RepID=UPI001B32FEA1|nr:hypothetical protein [Pseudomonas protegens]MBP5120978.1 hypothetical protein [Pseudomonas protegens]
MSNEMISVPRDKLEAMAFGHMEFDEFSQYMDELQGMFAMPAVSDDDQPASDHQFYTAQLQARAAKVLGLDPENTSWFEVVGEMEKAAQPQGERFTYSSKQATNCAECGLRKHTPLRVDDMGGYVCLTCIDNKLNELLATEQHQGEPVAQVEVLGGGGQLWLALKTQWLPVGLHNLYTRPAEQPAQKYDDTLLPFMELMRRELHANSHKGDRPEWLKMTASTALEEIAHHFNKLDEAVGARDNPQIREYAADIANICMMLLDICGELAFVRQPEPVSSTSDKYKAELYDEVWQLARDMGFGNVTDALMKLKKQTAPVAVVLPERNKASQNLDLEQCGYVDGWNACLDEAARLNPPQQ